MDDYAKFVEEGTLLIDENSLEGVDNVKEAKIKNLWVHLGYVIEAFGLGPFSGLSKAGIRENQALYIKQVKAILGEWQMESSDLVTAPSSTKSPIPSPLRSLVGGGHVPSPSRSESTSVFSQ